MEEMDNKNNFSPNIGLGKILFDYDQEKINGLLGRPDEEDIDKTSDSDYTVRYFYKALDISLQFHYEDNTFDYLSIHTKRIRIDHQDLSEISQDEILKVVENYHLHEGIAYDMTHSFDEHVNEESYSFENIGLTIWFENKEISDICLNPIFE